MIDNGHKATKKRLSNNQTQLSDTFFFVPNAIMAFVTV